MAFDQNSDSPDGFDQSFGETHCGPVDRSGEADIVAQIRYWHRRRVFMMDQRKRSDLALGAFMRGTALGWSLALPPTERKAIEARAADLIAVGERMEAQQQRVA